MGQIPSIETGILRAPTSATRQVQTIKASKAARGSAQPAAASQTPGQPRKEQGPEPC